MGRMPAGERRALGGACGSHGYPNCAVCSAAPSPVGWGRKGGCWRPAYRLYWCCAFRSAGRSIRRRSSRASAFALGWDVPRAADQRFELDIEMPTMSCRLCESRSGLFELGSTDRHAVGVGLRRCGRFSFTVRPRNSPLSLSAKRDVLSAARNRRYLADKSAGCYGCRQQDARVQPRPRLSILSLSRRFATLASALSPFWQSLRVISCGGLGAGGYWSSPSPRWSEIDPPGATTSTRHWGSAGIPSAAGGLKASGGQTPFGRRWS